MTPNMLFNLTIYGLILLAILVYIFGRRYEKRKAEAAKRGNRED